MKSSYNYNLWNEYTATRNLQTREKLLTKYLPLVKYVAGKMMFSLPTCVAYNDLLSAGVMGLIGALERFKPEQGVKFETFVLPRIKGAILDELRTLDWAPRSLRSKARMVEKVSEQLEKELGRSASNDEIANKLEMKIEDYGGVQLELSKASLLSLDGSRVEDNEQITSMYDLLEDSQSDNPHYSLEHIETKKLLIKAIEGLNEQEKIVMALYYYEELTLKEIGQVLSITESRVSQIHSKALGGLKGVLESEILN
ncbi:FliA/WhiG family RNA polymerase sigma factor [candidate division KSB1 bacterium]|nr:FliA/WhiG family RNA polymerase sigma factor [candidate division KSB1 bacterium]